AALTDAGVASGGRCHRWRSATPTDLILVWSPCTDNFHGSCRRAQTGAEYARAHRGSRPQAVDTGAQIEATGGYLRSLRIGQHPVIGRGADRAMPHRLRIAGSGQRRSAAPAARRASGNPAISPGGVPAPAPPDQRTRRPDADRCAHSPSPARTANTAASRCVFRGAPRAGTRFAPGCPVAFSLATADQRVHDPPPETTENAAGTGTAHRHDMAA